MQLLPELASQYQRAFVPAVRGAIGGEKEFQSLATGCVEPLREWSKRLREAGSAQPQAAGASHAMRANWGSNSQLHGSQIAHRYFVIKRAYFTTSSVDCFSVEAGSIRCSLSLTYICTRRTYSAFRPRTFRSCLSELSIQDKRNKMSSLLSSSAPQAHFFCRSISWVLPRFKFGLWRVCDHRERHCALHNSKYQSLFI
jgi:hypothetical protein